MEFHEAEFNKKATELLNISDILNDNWKINEKHEKLYLSKKKTIVLLGSPSQQPPDVDVMVNNDPAVAVVNARHNLVSIEYHVLFHPSYQVPALYFNAAYSDGSLISLEDISKIFVHEFESQSRHDEMKNIITQSEHPILFKPFFMVHPCKVNQLLSQFTDSQNFVLTFLTLFGPSIQLNINPGFEKFYETQSR